MSNETIGFIGLGVMGAPIAANLIKGGHTIVVYTSSAEKAQRFADLGATIADSPADVGRSARLVFSCVPDHAALLATVEGENGLASAGWSGGLLVDCSTIAPTEARSISTLLAAKGASFIDAPVSGGRKGAEDATLAIMCGGAEQDVARAMPAFLSMGKTIRHVGEVGAGQTIKACNQLMVVVNYLGACEAIGLARANGVDPKVMREVVLSSTGRSGVLENNALRYLENQLKPGFRLDLMKKDIGIANGIGEAARLVQPASDLALTLLRTASNLGLGELDSSAIALLYERLNGREATEA